MRRWRALQRWSGRLGLGRACSGRSRRGDGGRRRRSDARNSCGSCAVARGTRCPTCSIRVVNVVDLMTLQPLSEHPHGLPDEDFDALFTTDKPVIFAFHGYPTLIHRLTYRRTNHKNIHVRGYVEEGTTKTPFDMVVLNRA